MRHLPAFLFVVLPLTIACTALAQWQTDGAPVSVLPTVQEFPVIVSEGAGGAVVTWEDKRVDGVHYDIYARRVNASGTPLWTAGGTLVCGATDSQTYPQVISDGGGEAIMTWNDNRAGNADVYASRLGPEGSRPELVIRRPRAR